jgi:putative hydrolase of the HAD superfamily
MGQRYPHARVAPVRAVLFDVDFTLARPGPELGPEGYAELGLEHGLELDRERYGEARVAALADLERHPELDHDEEIWLRFTADIVRGMGGTGPAVERVAREIVGRWEHAHHFELYDDALPTLAELRRRGLKLGLVSNTSRDLDAFVRHFGIDVDAWISSGTHGKVKPSPLIFVAALDMLGVEASSAVMVGDSPEDDVEGARAMGMRAILLDRTGRHPEAAERIESLFELQAALGLGG